MVEKQEVFAFLNDVRKSGQINMFEGGKYVQEMFGVNRNEARDLVIEWMQTYGKTVNERI
jgi:hypothetical protein